MTPALARCRPSSPRCICEWPDTCGGLGTLQCEGCGGDQCVCLCGGEMSCEGCEDCNFSDDEGLDYADFA